MPIRPENRARYPKDWKAIRDRIMERAGNKCERCGVANYQVGRWRGGFFDAAHGFPKTFAEARQLAADEQESVDPDCENGKFIVVVLTIAHIHDHSPENCADDNLQALCQRCHNRHDVPHRSINRAATRKRGKAAGDLFP